MKKILWGLVGSAAVIGLVALRRAKMEADASKGFADYVQGNDTPERSMYVSQQHDVLPSPAGWNPNQLALKSEPVQQQAEAAAIQPTQPPVQPPAQLIQPSPSPGPVQTPAPSPAPDQEIVFHRTPTSGVYEPSTEPVDFMPQPVSNPHQPIQGLAGNLR